jgi:hypothetical protein
VAERVDSLRVYVPPPDPALTGRARGSTIFLIAIADRGVRRVFVT